MAFRTAKPISVKPSWFPHHPFTPKQIEFEIPATSYEHHTQVPRKPDSNPSWWISIPPQLPSLVPEALLLALPWPEHLERLSALQAALCSESLRQVAQGDAAVAERCLQDAQGGDGTAAPDVVWGHLGKFGEI